MSSKLKHKSPQEREARRNYIIDQIVTSGEATEILGLSRVRLHQLVKQGFIKPIESGIYLKDDITEYKKAYAEARSKNEWLKYFK